SQARNAYSTRRWNTRHDMTNEVIVLSGATRQARTSPWLPVRSVRVAPKRRPPASRIAPTSASVRRLPLRLNWLVLVISCTARVRSPHASRAADRSEEHTSELQSRGHLVCRLLLE